MSKKRGLSFDGGPVGYKRPPVEHQFKKGQKPPKRGPRRESKNFETIIGDVLEAYVAVSENGRKTRMSRKEALMCKAFALAMNGNMNDITRMMAIIERFAPAKAAPGPDVMWIRTIPGDEDM